jgi:Mce-associated membrane protein
MNSKAATKLPERSRSQEIILDFEPQRLAAPFFLRCGALFIDYIVVLIFPVSMMLLGRSFGTDGARLVGGGLNDSGWMIAAVIGVFNFFLLPIVRGQSIGKLITGLKIVSKDGRAARPMQIVLRNLLGYLVTVATIGLGFLISVLNPSGRTLHDYLFGTVVIYADRKYK